MAAGKEADRNKQSCRDTFCNVVMSHETCPRSQPIIFNPDFFVEKLRHEKPDAFMELVLSNVTRLIDLPGTEFAQLLGEVDPKLHSGTGVAAGFFRSLNFLKRKDKGVVFGAPLTEEGIAQIYQLIEYLHKNLQVEGLFRVPGNSIRQQALKECLNSGIDIDLDSGEYHPNDVASLLKTFLGELPETLLTHKHYHAHLKIADMTLFDEKGNKTTVPDKERQIEALQLLFMLLPPANRSLLKLLLDLLYQTARQQEKNKMSASNLALMFAPQIMWPKNLTTYDLQENMMKLNYGMAFMIKHSQKIFRAPFYIREHARIQFSGSKMVQSKDDLDLLPSQGSKGLLPSKRNCIDPPCSQPDDSRYHTEEALKELFRHVHNMPESAKKKKIVRQFNKQATPSTPVFDTQTPPRKKHARSRSFGGLIKRKVLGNQFVMEKKNKNVTPETTTCSSGQRDKACKEDINLNVLQRPQDSPALLNRQLCPQSSNDYLGREEESCSLTNVCFSPTHESSV
ncbi:rho GTPase-activating protein 19-like [Acipenser oxyrinchus oxyrinchus]|uniref:Rho GTPase-activating protein 19 n=1 Tax=Acipenser oxyrinchus oxyrinchus TaxID=40147 RepID=A0AAD8D979_ACIOX|nr:rho GTPase-activating protein 19-like [Acipenser oxyrinchus oxyrinchus]